MSNVLFLFLNYRKILDPSGMRTTVWTLWFLC